MKCCASCGRPLPPKPPRGPQPDYCGEPDCTRQRDADRKALERARAFNALARVITELPERPKRGTSVSSRWDEIDEAWQGSKLYDVDRLMAEAERGVRLLDRSAGTPVGQFSGGSRFDYEDRGCPGELWLKGEHDAAIAKAERELRLLRARRLP